MGNFFKIVPTPPYREKNIKRALHNDLFLFDSKYMFKNGSYTYVYGFSNKAIALPFSGRVVSDYNGKFQNKKISLCYDLYGRVISYIIPNTYVILCIEDLDETSSKYGFTLFNEKEIN